MPIDILIVEDDAQQRELMLQALSSRGWTTHATGGVAEGFAAALRLKPLVVVTDIQLPDGSGFDLCLRLKTHPETRSPAVLMITGSYKKDEDRLRAQEMGADAYLLKPFHLSDFLETVARLRGCG